MDIEQPTCYSCVLRELMTGITNVATTGYDSTFKRQILKKALSRLDSISSSYGEESHMKMLETGSVLNPVHENTPDTFWIIYKLLMTFLNRDEEDNLLDLLSLAYNLMKNCQIVHLSLLDVTRMFSRAALGLNRRITRENFHFLMEVPYDVEWFLLQDETDRDFYILKQVVWDSVRAGSERLLSDFLKYGVMFLPTSYFDLVGMEQIRYAEAITYLLYTLRDYRFDGFFSLPPHNKAFHVQVGMSSNRMCLILRAIELLAMELKKRSDVHQEEEYPETNRSIFSHNKKDSSSSRSIYFRCFRRIFETIPEPYVTSTEVRKVLQLSCTDDDQETLNYINEVISEFEHLYPESTGSLTPRSLKHLSRCRVRDSLRQSGALPHGVKSLKLTTLEKYILLKD